MKGYLSRISSQSGLRFSSKGAVSPRRASEPHAGSPPKPLDREETVLVTPEPGSSRKKLALSSDESLVSTASGSAPAELVQSVLVEPSTIIEQHEKLSPDPSRAVSTEPEAPEKQPEKHYFTRTAEIIGGRVAEPVEVQTILLREVQEWAAAGTGSAAAEGTAVDKSVESVAFSSETFETKEVVRIAEPEAGVVRIGEKRLPASVPQEALRIEEQRFDLSIGTISVVIEGDERAPQPTPAARTESGSRCERQATRQFSRLSRNYL